MNNLYKYYIENEKEAVEIMQKHGLTELKFPMDIEFPTLLVADCDGNLYEVNATAAKINDDGKLEIEAIDADNYTAWYKTSEIPYMSANETLETIVSVVNEFLTD